MALVGNIADWKVIGDAASFTVIGLTTDNKIVFWKDGEWKVL